MGSVEREGRNACIDGKRLEDNPYSNGPEYKRKEWIYGWLDHKHRSGVGYRLHYRDK